MAAVSECVREAAVLVIIADINRTVFQVHHLTKLLSDVAVEKFAANKKTDSHQLDTLYYQRSFKVLLASICLIYILF